MDYVHHPARHAYTFGNDAQTLGFTSILSMLLVILRKAWRFNRYIPLALPAGQWQIRSHTRGQYLLPQRPFNCSMPASLSSILVTCPPLQRKRRYWRPEARLAAILPPHTALSEAKAVEARRERRVAALPEGQRRSTLSQFLTLFLTVGCTKKLLASPSRHAPTIKEP